MKLRIRAAALLAAIPLVLGAALAATALPASASVIEQCDPNGGCANFWGGGFAISAYYGSTGNNAISIQWLNSTQFELRDNLHGGCVGDYGNSPTDARAGGGLSCPSSGNAGWGTIWTRQAVCGTGFWLYLNRHSGGYLGWAQPYTGYPVYVNAQGSSERCLQQRS